VRHDSRGGRPGQVELPTGIGAAAFKPLQRPPRASSASPPNAVGRPMTSKARTRQVDSPAIGISKQTGGFRA
jgi:hypothetical protein